MKTTLLIIAITCANLSFSQTQKAAMPNDFNTLTSKYLLEFELVDTTLTSNDYSLLSTLSLALLERLRQDTEDVIFLDEDSNQNVLIYSRKRIAKKLRTENKY